MYSRYYTLKPRAIRLRKAGKTYGEIKKILGEPIPKSTLSHWFRDVTLSEVQQSRINKQSLVNISVAQGKARLVNRARREKYLQEVRGRVEHLPKELWRKDSAKIALAMLYLGEGSKKSSGTFMFGNSDPLVVQLFLRLFRYCYNLEKTKFRCTLQCRADQDIERLEKFWSQLTRIPRTQFYAARIDPRTKGKRTHNSEYKGVCRIDYFSADILNEWKQIMDVIYKGL